MARADSTIRVNIIGDAKSLQTAAGKAEGAVGGMNKKLLAAGGIIAGAFVVDGVVDFANTAVKEADRVADATSNIEAQLGPELSRALIDRADDFSKLGQSEGDMLELEKRIIDIGTASGASDPQLAGMAEQLAAAAGAMALTDTEGRDANYWIEQIGKAADGSKKPLLELGVNLDEAAVEQQALADTGKSAVDELTAEDYWAARVKLIMEQLTPKIKDVTTGTGDLEQRQAELNAKMETFSGEVGPIVQDVLIGLLDFINQGIAGWQMFAAWVRINEKGFRDFAGPVARAIDLLKELIGLIDKAINLASQFGGEFGGTNTLNQFSRTRQRSTSGFGSGSTYATVNVNGGSPEAIEQAVRTAVRHATGRGPLE